MASHTQKYHSHLGHNQIVHRSSMLQLKIDDQMFVLFHGNLIYGGAQSKKENKWSFNYGQDVCLFAYIDKIDQSKNITFDVEQTDIPLPPKSENLNIIQVSNTADQFCVKYYDECVL